MDKQELLNQMSQFKRENTELKEQVFDLVHKNKDL
jgi:hypothetical protein